MLFALHEDNTNGSFEVVFIVCFCMFVHTGYTLAYTLMVALVHGHKCYII